MDAAHHIDLRGQAFAVMGERASPPGQAGQMRTKGLIQSFNKAVFSFVPPPL